LHEKESLVEPVNSIGSRVHAVVINYRTPGLTRRLVETLRNHYPNLPLLLIDNGSKDESAEILRGYCENGEGLTKLVSNDYNLHHGPAMDQAVKLVEREFILFLDSDCEIVKGGFVEEMIRCADADSRCYAVGRMTYKNRHGFDTTRSEKTFRYINPFCMLMRKHLYTTLPPFVHHGAPCLHNMREAALRGYSLIDFPVLDYVSHKGRGTAQQYGYGLGLKGKLGFVLSKLGI
jgi:GT2 family glycosyltransferase